MSSHLFPNSCERDRRSIRFRLAALAGIALFLLSCRDHVTGPSVEMPAPSISIFDIVSDTNAGKKDVGDTGAWTGEVSTWDGSSPLSTTPFVFPFPTVIQVTITGNVYKGDGALPTNELQPWTPLGIGPEHGGAIAYRLASAQGSYPVLPTKLVDTVTVQYEMAPFRAAITGAQPYNGPSGANCGTANTSDPKWACYTYTGSTSLTWSRFDVGLGLSRSNGTGPVDADTTVLFVAAPLLATIGGRGISMHEVKWTWVPSSGNAADTLACSGSGANCTKKMLGSGTMHVGAYVNGKWKTASVAVTVTGAPGVPKRCKDIPVFRDSFPEIANDKIDSVLKELWLDSKYSPDSTNKQRREVGGFILLKPGGSYDFQPFATQGGACSIPYERPPSNAVAEVHSQPFGKDESVYACGSNKRYKSGPTNWLRYFRAPSRSDVRVLDEHFSRDQKDLKGFIIDADGLITYDRVNRKGTPRARCSY